MAKKPTKEIHQKEYTLKELYGGYYWFILHIDPFHGPDGWKGEGGYIIPKDYWKSEMPDCVKTAIEKYTCDQPLKHTMVAEGGYLTKRACSVDEVFSWFASKNIPLLNADDREIKSLMDLRRLWTTANTYDSSNNKIPLTQHDAFKKAAYSERFYHDYHTDILQALESYLEPQHKKNLEMLDDPGAGGGDKDSQDMGKPAPKGQKDVVKVNIATREISYADNGSRTLDSAPVKLLERLNKGIGNAVSKDDLMSWTWGENAPFESELYTGIKKLRKVFKSLKIPAKIDTIHRVGYKLIPKKGVIFDIK